MKRRTLTRVISLNAFISIISLITFNTNAQTSVRAVNHINIDTLRQMNTIEAFDVQVFSDDTQKFIVVINNPFEEKLKISITSREGAEFNDQTRNINYRKRFNMTEAPDGTYTITVIGTKKTFSKTITLQTSTITNRGLQLQ